MLRPLNEQNETENIRCGFFNDKLFIRAHSNMYCYQLYGQI